MKISFFELVIIIGMLVPFLIIVWIKKNIFKNLFSITWIKKNIFKNPFSFKGRIRRLEYGLSEIIAILFYFVIALLLGLSMQLFFIRSSLLSFLVSVVLVALFILDIWFILAQRAKRCHDRGNKGWFQFIPFYELWMLFGDGEFGENKYGENPKGIAND